MPVAPLACYTVARTEVNFNLGMRYVVGGRGQEIREVNKRWVCGVAKEINTRASIRGNTVHAQVQWSIDLLTGHPEV